MLPKSKVDLYAAIRRDARTGRPLADLAYRSAGASKSPCQTCGAG